MDRIGATYLSEDSLVKAATAAGTAEASAGNTVFIYGARYLGIFSATIDPVVGEKLQQRFNVKFKYICVSSS